jgi:hypothetical protein
MSFLDRVIQWLKTSEAARRHKAALRRTHKVFPAIAENKRKIAECRRRHERGANEALRQNFKTMMSALKRETV